MSRLTRRANVALAVLLALAPATSAAQHEHRPPSAADSAHTDSTVMSMQGAMAGPLGIPTSRMGSGTSWLPDDAPMHAQHFQAGGWELMLHGVAFIQFDKQFTTRGDEQFGSVNWGMLMARHSFGGGLLTLRDMMSLEPFTVTARGYPLLLQSGESYDGQPLHDRQHPHDLFMELAAQYERPIAQNLGLSLYLAPVGEPALGPVAFPHRPSAAGDPLAPLGHHWQDATHISFGVITAGIYSRMWRLEGSIFNGREPDAIRTNFDYAGRRLDSYSGRLTVNPDPHWSLAASYGYLASPEELHPEESQHRLSASVLNERTFRKNGDFATSLIWGANKYSGVSGLSNSVLAETNLDLDGTNTVFGRAEFVQKAAGDLLVDGVPPSTTYNVGSLVLGYIREISKFTGGSMGLGARGSLDIVPSALESTYGTRTPGGFTIFLRFRPSRMHMAGLPTPASARHEMKAMPGVESPTVSRSPLP